jgi:hypothetical protein
MRRRSRRKPPDETLLLQWNEKPSTPLGFLFCNRCVSRASDECIVRAQAPGATCACWIGWVPVYRSRVSYAAARYGRTRSFEPENNPF